MIRLRVRLYAGRLSNPDLDIRYDLPDLISERSGGTVRDGGYSYGAVEEEGGAPPLVLLLLAQDEAAVGQVIDVLQNVRVLDNDLALAAEVFAERDGAAERIFPPAISGG
jgi:hypothetical protein